MFIIYVCCFASVMGKQVNYHPHNSIYVRTEEGPSFICIPNLKRIALFRSKIIRGPKTSKLGHVTQATPN